MNLIHKYWKETFPILFGLVLGMVFITFKSIGFDFQFFPGDLGDARFNMYILEHGYLFLSGKIQYYWGAPFMFPEANVITYSDNLLGSVPIYAAFRFLNYDRETSFQLWYLFITALNYACAYLFLRSTFKNNYAAALGAMIFAFSLALQSQMTHAQTFARFPVPLVLWMCIKFAEDLNSKYFWLALFFLVVQFYCGIYLGFMLAVPMGLLLLFIFIYKRKLLIQKLRNAKWVSSLGISLVVNGTLLFVLMKPYLERAKQMPSISYDSIVATIPSLKSFVYSQHGSLLWNSLDRIADHETAWWDHQLFPGAIAILGLLLWAYFIIAKRKSGATINSTLNISSLLFATSLITILLFIRFGDISLYRILFTIPGFSSMRSLTRIINVELIFFAIAVAFITQKLFTRLPRYSVLIFVIFTFVIIADNYFESESIYKTRKEEAQGRVEYLKQKIKHLPSGSIVSYEPAHIDEKGPAAYQLDAMLACQDLHLRTINAYSGSSPGSYTAFWFELNEAARIDWLRSMEYGEIDLFIVK